MSILPNSLPDGEARKQAAHRLLETLREQLVRRGRRALLSHLIDHGSGTIDDVRRVVSLPPNISPKLFGTVPGPLALLRIIRPDGSRKTARAVGHARPVTIWTLADHAAAVAWLAAHPDLPDPIAST